MATHQPAHERRKFSQAYFALKFNDILFYLVPYYIQILMDFVCATNCPTLHLCRHPQPLIRIEFGFRGVYYNLGPIQSENGIYFSFDLIISALPILFDSPLAGIEIGSSSNLTPPPSKYHSLPEPIGLRPHLDEGRRPP